MSAAPALRALHADIAAEGGLLAGVLVDPAAAAAASQETALGALASSGPRTAADPDEYATVIEAIREGYLLHYAGGGRVVAPQDPDLALLAGDRLYALGLARLAVLGDLAAVAALAEVIALCAQAHASQDQDLADAVWEAGAVQVGWGDDPALRAARDGARAADPGAAHALRAAARQASADRAGSS